MASDGLQERIIQSLREGVKLRLLLIETCVAPLVEAAGIIKECIAGRHKILLLGNGGSAADAQHIAAEFVCRFTDDRDPLPALALTTDTSVLTAIANDYGFDQVFARQVRAHAQSGDIVVAISTSGRSPNVLTAVEVARQMGLTTIGLSGHDGGNLARLVNISIVVPSCNTARIQECHMTIAHILCEMVDPELSNLPRMSS